MKRILIILILTLLLLAGCAAGDAPSETHISTDPTVTQPSSLPPEPETQETETQEPTEAPTEPEPVAQSVTEGVCVYLGSANATNSLCDGSHYSKQILKDSTTLRIESAQPFAAVYIEWDGIPGDYAITWEGGSVSCGENDFLHEYIRLPEAVTEVWLSLPEGFRCTICDVSLYTAGTAPDGVQDWLPPCEQADILVFPTHSDDDVLFFGPLISYYAIERGLTVQTAFMVDHSWQYERAHERLNGLWEMGVRNYPILGSAPDTAETSFSFGMSYYANSNIPQWQVEQIRRFRPLVVVGHDLDGEYGNAGHKVNAYYLVQSIVDAADPEKYPESAEAYGTWDTPKLYIHLYPENEWYFDVNTPLANDPQGRTPFQVAQDAFEYHVSQHTGSLRLRQSDDARIWDCRPFGLYRTLVGPDTMADVMDNIDPDDWR